MRDFRENSVFFPEPVDHIKPCWYWDKRDLAHTPSQSEGLDPATEARYRREGARFIFDVGTRLGLHYDTLATGIIYFHRFYMFHSFKQFPRYVTGGCCLFLAGKVEETPKKCKDIIKTARSLLNDVQFAQFGDDPKEEVMVLERILLQTIKFDLQVDHPYQFLLRYAKQLKGDKNKVQKLVQMAWTFVNDSLCTMLSLQWEPEIIAVAVMYLAGRLCKFDIQEWTAKQSSRRWWEQFVQDVPVEVLEDICHQILDLYSQGKQQMPQGAAALGGGGDKPLLATPPAAAPPPPQVQVQQTPTAPAVVAPPPPAPPPLTRKPSPAQTSPPRPALKRTHPSPKEDIKSSELVGSKIPRLEPPMPPLPATLPSADRKAPPSYPLAHLPLPGDPEPSPNPPDASSKVSLLAPPLQHQPPPLPHRPPPPPPQPPQQAATNSYIMGIPTDSSYMSGEGYQSLQSMMKTAVPPQAYAAAPLGYHSHGYAPAALPPAPPAVQAVSSYHPPPPLPPPPSSVYAHAHAHHHPLPPPYTHSYAMPPPAHMVSMAEYGHAAEYGQHGLGGYPPPPPSAGQGQGVLPHHSPLPPPPGMPPMSGMPRGGSWMR